MESLLDLLKYFGLNAGATFAGILYWMAIENMQPVELKQKEHQKLSVVLVLSLLFTPIGAWVISTIIRIRKIALTLKSTND